MRISWIAADVYNSKRRREEDTVNYAQRIDSKSHTTKHRCHRDSATSIAVTMDTLLTPLPFIPIISLQLLNFRNILVFARHELLIKAM